MGPAILRIRGAILANMSAFKEHCSFGFWGEEIGAVLAQRRCLQDGAMGSLGRITSVATLPPEKQLIAWVRQATAFVDSGKHISPIAARSKVVKAPKPALKTPPEFTTALRKNKKAASAFAAFSPSCQREYIEWIADAKRPETRDQRIATAVELDRRRQAAQLEVPEVINAAHAFLLRFAPHLPRPSQVSQNLPARRPQKTIILFAVCFSAHWPEKVSMRQRTNSLRHGANRWPRVAFQRKRSEPSKECSLL